MSKSAGWVGYVVSVDCGESCGVYEGTILHTDDATITLTNAIRNGFPSPNPQDILNVADIEKLKVIDGPPSAPKHTHKTDAGTKRPRISVRKDLQANNSISGAVIDPRITCQAPTVVAMVAAQRSNEVSGLTVVRYNIDSLHPTVGRSSTKSDVASYTSTDILTAATSLTNGSFGCFSSNSRSHRQPEPMSPTLKRPIPFHCEDANGQSLTTPEEALLISAGTTCTSAKKRTSNNDRSPTESAASLTPKRPRHLSPVKHENTDERSPITPKKVIFVSTDTSSARANKNTGRSRPTPAASSMPKRRRFPIKRDDADEQPATMPKKALLVSARTPTARAKKKKPVAGSTSKQPHRRVQHNDADERLPASPEEASPVSAATPSAAASGSAGSCSGSRARRRPRRPSHFYIKFRDLHSKSKPTAGPASKRPKCLSPFYNILLDSESEAEDDVLAEDEEELVDDTNPENMRLVARKLREYEVYRQERETEALAELVVEAEAIRIEEGLPEPDGEDRIEIELVGEWGQGLEVLGDNGVIRVLAQGDGVGVTNEGAGVGNLAESDGAEIQSKGDGVGVMFKDKGVEGLTESDGVGDLRKGDEVLRDVAIGVLTEGARVGNLADGDGVGIQSEGDRWNVLGGENNIRAGASDGGIASKDFSWSENFSTFSSREEQYFRRAGPNVRRFNKRSRNKKRSRIPGPIDLFLQVWNRPIMELIVSETNKYAQQIIDALVEQGHPISDTLSKWKETTVDEMYRLFVILNYMSLDYRCRMDEYWTIGVLGMPAFRKIMSRSRFFMLLRFLNFVDNYEMDANLRSHDRKINKIRPILDHCVQKFSEMYVPKKHLSLDESLLIWKGRLSWAQCIRSKKARFGIRSFELCEAESGYLLGCVLYAGEGSSAVEGAIQESESPTAKVVLQLMESYLDLGHCLVMDNWYNQLVLTRQLKMRRTDVVGTMNRQREHVPYAIRKAEEKGMQRGDIISRHCGDMSLVAWKDVKLVTTLSTFHDAETTVVVRRADKRVVQPKVVRDYNKYKGGVDLKDQKLNLFKFERKVQDQCRWHVKVFRRLLNTSFLNTYILYTKYPHKKPYSQRQFRFKIAEELLNLFPRPQVDRALPSKLPAEMEVRLDKKLDHYPAHIEQCQGTGKKRRRRCVRCSKRGLRKQVLTICTKCNVGLCLDQCWVDYHTLVKLSEDLDDNIAS